MLHELQTDLNFAPTKAYTLQWAKGFSIEVGPHRWYVDLEFQSEMKQHVHTCKTTRQVECDQILRWNSFAAVIPFCNYLTLCIHVRWQAFGTVRICMCQNCQLSSSCSLCKPDWRTRPCCFSENEKVWLVWLAGCFFFMVQPDLPGKRLSERTSLAAVDYS